MEHKSSSLKIWIYLFITWLGIGIVSHLSAILWMIQYDEQVTAYRIFDVGFYYYVPVLLWSLYTPLLIKWYDKYPLSGRDWKWRLSLHILISVLFAPIARILAITVDFSIKYVVGMETNLPWEIVYQARFIVVGSAARALLFYWIAIVVIEAYKYSVAKKNKKADNQIIEEAIKRIAVPYKAGKKLIDVQEIFWIEANRNYVHIHTSKQSFRLRESLASLAKRLDQQQFLQIHRSRIINKQAVESLNHWRRGEYLIRLQNNKLLSSSRSYQQNIRLIMNK